ncbi:MAG: recombinase RecT [Neisseriaceae bacterium]|nr:recombinase RecT [Neisseriaceae bacterium]
MANLPMKAFFQQDAIQMRIKELAGKNAGVFTTAVLQLTNGNPLLQQSEPMSIFNAACMALTLNLPINANLGFAYLVPYKHYERETKESKVLCQFQLGYKGFIQLAQRSGQFVKLDALPVYAKQLIKQDPINGFVIDWSVEHTPNEKPIGYYAFFKLTNGFFAELYMTLAEVEQHGKRYSQSFQRNKGVWVDNFDAMARKTVLKLLLSRQAPLSIEMQTAVQADQAIINSIDGDYRYVDNETDTEKQAVELTQGVDSPEREEIIVNAEEIAKTGNLDNLKEYLTKERRRILGKNEAHRLAVFCSAIAKLRPLPTEEIGSNAVQMSDKCKTDIEKMAVADAVDCVLNERTGQPVAADETEQQTDDEPCPF